MLRSSAKAYDKAAKKAKRARDHVVHRAMCLSNSPEAMRLDDKIRALVRSGYYEHFKSSKDKPKFYRVYEALSHVNVYRGHNAYHVRYAALYPPQAGRKALRELTGPDGFLTPIDRPEYKGPRFVWRGTKRPKRAKAT